MRHGWRVLGRGRFYQDGWGSREQYEQCVRGVPATLLITAPRLMRLRDLYQAARHHLRDAIADPPVRITKVRL